MATRIYEFKNGILMHRTSSGSYPVMESSKKGMVPITQSSFEKMAKAIEDFYATYFK